MLKRGIKQKLIASLVVSTLLLMSLFFILLDRYLKDHSISVAEKTIFVLGQNTSSLLSSPLFNNDYNQLSSIVQPIILEEFDYLVIFDNLSRNIAFKMDSLGVTESIQWEKNVKNIDQFQRQVLELQDERYTQFLFPISSPGVNKPLGFLVIGVSEKKMNSTLAGITQRIVIISVLFFLAFSFATYFLSNKIVRPIKELSYKIGKFASGNYDVRSDIDTRDEIGNLSYNFNFMADKINEQLLSIEKYNKDLEKMVEERTKELLKALDAIKEKDSKLNQAEKINSLNAIVSSIAHEINNPLAIISGNVQLIEAKVADDKLRKKLTTAQVAIDRIATLIDEINFFAAIKNVEIEHVAFPELLSDVLERVVPKEVSVTIDSKGNDEGPIDQIETNEHLLSVSIENILNNSIEFFKYRNIRGHIEIRYYKDNPYNVIEINDNAGGIQELTRVFDPFYTTFNEKKGLGLTFVYHAIQALNGEIRVENTIDTDRDEKGAKFTFKLPLPLIEETENDEIEGFPWQQ